MSAAEKVAFCREWYERGQCPGCGADLAVVAGNGDYHDLNGYRLTNSFCRWSGDDLTSLVLIGGGFLPSFPKLAEGVAAPIRRFATPSADSAS